MRGSLGVKIYQVDAFTEEPFSGNPAAVCILLEERGGSWMQKVAREMNLSETAFVRRRGEEFILRWFTPAVEVELCGHATLASAHILWEKGYVDPREGIRFRTLSGVLTASRRGDWIELDFPAEPEKPARPPPGLGRALGVTPRYVGKNRFDYLVEVDSEEVLRSMTPDFNLLKSVPARGVIVTCPSAAPEYDFVSRFFAPRVGVNEDPVTGSAHCCLGPFWSRRLNKTEFLAYQASSRGGVVRVRLSGDRVILGGRGVTVMEGELWV
jgi:predicted PhzF superfamily epimerase YddE/YHI9